MSSDTSASSPELQVELLRSSFEQVTPHAHEFSKSFYAHLFADYPAAAPLFAHTDIELQSDKLLSSLVFVVKNLEKRLFWLRPCRVWAHGT